MGRAQGKLSSDAGAPGSAGDPFARLLGARRGGGLERPRYDDLSQAHVRLMLARQLASAALTIDTSSPRISAFENPCRSENDLFESADAIICDAGLTGDFTELIESFKGYLDEHVDGAFDAVLCALAATLAAGELSAEDRATLSAGARRLLPDCPAWQLL